jgi:hypothetical protein
LQGDRLQLQERLLAVMQHAALDRRQDLDLLDKCVPIPWHAFDRPCYLAYREFSRPVS